MHRRNGLVTFAFFSPKVLSFYIIKLCTYVTVLKQIIIIILSIYIIYIKKKHLGGENTFVGV